MYQLIFRGECTPGTDIATARENARALFKASVDQVERMFSGRTVVIRNRLEQEQAEKYRTVLARHGMIAYVESMSPEPAATRPVPPPAGTRPQPAPGPQASPVSPAEGVTDSDRQGMPEAASASADSQGVRVEPGERLPVAGKRVDDVLSNSTLQLDPVGVRLEQERDVPEPEFEHLDEWSLAPPGADLGVERELPPPVVPDVSHLSLQEPDKKPAADE